MSGAIHMAQNNKLKKLKWEKGIALKEKLRVQIISTWQKIIFITR